jgi:hypothetical protein
MLFTTKNSKLKLCVCEPFESSQKLADHERVKTLKSNPYRDELPIPFFIFFLVKYNPS